MKLFLEQGYQKTSIAEIVKRAEVSNSTFQNIFRAKDGVLTELVKFMFGSQFGVAHSAANAKLPPVYVYAAETAIQLTLTELNENLRDIYIEAYTLQESSAYIFSETAKVLYEVFGSYQPDLSLEDFYTLEIGSAGIMRAYMAYPCGERISLKEKISRFLTLALRGYKVPENELEQVIAFVNCLNICSIAEDVMHKLFKELAMHFEFTLNENKTDEV